MANDRQETHVWFDGESWWIYTERRHDIARFAEWFGPPERVGAGRVCAHWSGIDRNALRIRRKAARPASAAKGKGNVSALEKWREARRQADGTEARGHKDSP